MGKGNPRKQGKEQFYTLPAVAKEYAKIMVDRYGTDRTYLEPSGGKGAFIDSLADLGVEDIMSFDIEPKHPRIQQADFLRQLIWEKHLIAIGNPPFGRACSLAIKFFNRCANNCDVIAFIIPPSFNKPSIQDQLDPYFHQVEKHDVPDIAFHDDNDSAHEGGLLRTQFQIWERRDYKREMRQKYRSPAFTFVKKDDNPDLAFRTHGNGAGKVLEGLDYNPRTTAFIKIVDPDAQEALEQADFSWWMNQTSHIPCLAPAEIAMVVDEYISKKA